MLTSCGGFELFGHKSNDKGRDIASITVKELANEEATTFKAEIDEKLLSLHSYYVIAQVELAKFDAQLDNQGLEELYQSSAYLSLTATRTQVDEIEDEIFELWTSLNEKKTKSSNQKSELLIQRIETFAKQSHLSALSMKMLEEKLSLNIVKTKDLSVAKEQISQEVKRLEVSKEFQIYEKNIEHLSHMMAPRSREEGKTFYPSTLGNGELTGSEFPSKVWALTFNDGPTKNSTTTIVKNLKSHDLKATFFQLAQKVEENRDLAKTVRDSGMEIGAHSYSHKLLTLVGSLTLEKEITHSTQNIEKSLKLDIKFFRLPYGVGASVPNIRQKLVDNELIHVGHTVDTLDWVVQTSDKIVKRTRVLMKKSPKDSGIILFHDSHKTTIEASAILMKDLKENGRRTCTVGEIVSQINEGVETVCPKS